ncbi:MAG: imidazole glycerol phosphate synthase subunit HisH [Firmicutes bacterium HGW-Firmicutes-20]|jgi:glutamine amidotransferase|nr:MAG: imidazole glycerol phosphate synthase subunit HisH [Firmicutes bacterium HGW-Firmicutes-20]PKM89853.1 MAG: imidazole glycerol phosphate synthase subunit HisH [Firmicutes bacterium HGW-Firmicutes-10]
MIVIVDYGVGNIRNVERALTKLGMEVIVTRDIEMIDQAKAIILPGVGAFRDAIGNLIKYDLVDCLKRNAEKGTWIVGICLGMQLLYDKSYEDGEYEGLGLLRGEIVKFDDSDLKVPHMGWNRLIKQREDELTQDLTDQDYVYFVHSYYLKSDDKEQIIFTSSYGVDVPAIVRKDNIIGMQFHPEKSGAVGVKILRNLKELIV